MFKPVELKTLQGQKCDFCHSRVYKYAEACTGEQLAVLGGCCGQGESVD